MNIILSLINFLLFIVFWILSNFFVYEENIISYEEEELIPKSNNNRYDKINSKVQNINKKIEIDLFEMQFLNKRKVQGLPHLKLFLLFISYWINDDSQKLVLIIILPFLEIFDYLSHNFYSKINEILKKQKNNLEDERNVETLNKNSINEIQNDKNKKKQNNYYLFYFFFYITLQDFFLVINISVFALTNYSFGLNIQTYQKSKFLYILTYITYVILYILEYKYILIILGFFLEKEIYDKYNNQQYTLDFLVRKILLGLRIDLEIIYFLYQILININDKNFVDLSIYCFLNISLLLFDYIGYLISKLRIIIYNKVSKTFNFIRLIQSE